MNSEVIRSSTRQTAVTTWPTPDARKDQARPPRPTGPWCGPSPVPHADSTTSSTPWNPSPPSRGRRARPNPAGSSLPERAPAWTTRGGPDCPARGPRNGPPGFRRATQESVLGGVLPEQQARSGMQLRYGARFLCGAGQRAEPGERPVVERGIADDQGYGARPGSSRFTFGRAAHARRHRHLVIFDEIAPRVAVPQGAERNRLESAVRDEAQGCPWRDQVAQRPHEKVVEPFEFCVEISLPRTLLGRGEHVRDQLPHPHLSDHCLCGREAFRGDQPGENPVAEDEELDASSSAGVHGSRTARSRRVSPPAGKDGLAARRSAHAAQPPRTHLFRVFERGRRLGKAHELEPHHLREGFALRIPPRGRDRGGPAGPCLSGGDRLAEGGLRLADLAASR